MKMDNQNQSLSSGMPINSENSYTNQESISNQQRKGSSSKLQMNTFNVSANKGQSTYTGTNILRSNNIHRGLSLDSSAEFKVTPLSNIPDHSDEDSEEENNNNFSNTSEKFSNIRPKRPHQRYASRSLPVTPRINGNCSTLQSSLNGILSSPFVNGLGGRSSTPVLISPHLIPHMALDGSYNSLGSLSPCTSQYVTCNSGILNESIDKPNMPGNIDYSSLPLPKEDGKKTSGSKNHISRHMSDPCIDLHEMPSCNNFSSTVNCKSCPQRKNSFKHRRKDVSTSQQDLDSSSSPGNNMMSGIESNKDDVDGVETQWQFIRTLVDELNKSRTQSNRMTVELHQAKMEIQMLKSTMDSYSEAGIRPGIIAEMVGQIHAAQKVRDEAMMSRIKLANEERDAALTQTKSLLEKLGLSPRAGFDHSPNYKDYDHFPIAHNRHDDIINLSSLDKEVSNIKIPLNIQAMLHDKYITSQCCRIPKEGDEYRPQKLIDELKVKLNDSESSRLHLQDRCSKLEHTFGSLGRKVNGLNPITTANWSQPGSLSAFMEENSTHQQHMQEYPTTSSSQERMISTSNHSSRIHCLNTDDTTTSYNTSSSLNNVLHQNASSDGENKEDSSLDSTEHSSSTLSSYKKDSGSSITTLTPPPASFNNDMEDTYLHRNINGQHIMGPITEL